MTQRNKQMFDATWVGEAVQTLIGQLLEQPDLLEDAAIIGIRTRGATLANRIAEQVSRQTGQQPPLGALDITLYRDDLNSARAVPAVRATQIPFNVEGKKILLVDDVLYTGRTIRAALDELIDFGRPRWIRLAVLIDRGCRELPVCADYAAHRVSVPPEHFLRVHFGEVDGADEVIIIER